MPIEKTGFRPPVPVATPPSCPTAPRPAEKEAAAVKISRTDSVCFSREAPKATVSLQAVRQEILRAVQQEADAASIEEIRSQLQCGALPEDSAADALAILFPAGDEQ